MKKHTSFVLSEELNKSKAKKIAEAVLLSVAIMLIVNLSIETSLMAQMILKSVN